MAGGKQLKPALPIKLKDEDAEKARRNHDERITELQGVEIVRGRLYREVELPNQVNVPIHHKLGRIAVVIPGVPYAKAGSVTTGGILRDRTRLTTDFDPRNYAVLYAEGWGTTMYVDVWIF
jgi:hypothetical protein